MWRAAGETTRRRDASANSAMEKENGLPSDLLSGQSKGNKMFAGSGSGGRRGKAGGDGEWVGRSSGHGVNDDDDDDGVTWVEVDFGEAWSLASLVLQPLEGLL